MFGTNENSIWQFLNVKTDISVVCICTESNVFQMFFDKTYRPNRYNAIVTKSTPQNHNDFRTKIMQTYPTFPKSSLENIQSKPERANILLENVLAHIPFWIEWVV